MRDAPQELIDAMLAFAHSDAPTLRAARLVSRAWNVSARAHLFRALELSLVPDRRSSSSASNPLQRVLSVLESSADVRESVREVTLESSLSRSSSSSPHSASYCSAASTEASALALTLILALLPRVRVLHLRSLRLSFPFSSPPSISPSYSPSPSLSPLPPALLLALLRVLQSPTLSHLEFWNCELESPEALLGLLSHACSLSGSATGSGRGTVASARVSHVRFTHTSTGAGPSPTSSSSAAPVPIANSFPSAFVSTAPSSDSASELASEDGDDPEDDTPSPFHLSSTSDFTAPSPSPSFPCSSSPTRQHQRQRRHRHRHQRSALKHLTLESTPLAPLLALDAQPQNAIDLRSVRHLSLVHMGGGGDMSSVQSLLDRVGDGLEVLDLRGGPGCRTSSYLSLSLSSVLTHFIVRTDQTTITRLSSQSPPLHLGALPNLTTLRLSGLQWTPTHCPAEALSALLASSSSSSTHPPSSLQSLHLTVTALRLRSSRPPSPSPSPSPAPSPIPTPTPSPTSPPAAAEPSSHQPLPTAPWSTLGSTLAHPHFRSLKRVEVRVMAVRKGDVDVEGLESALGGFGGEEREGRVRVSVDVF
ncbi:unnamed protein product [Cyclocybe aegerita]|uniref:F-box domain-containing protein n=1 Tax=Cyclocybe aegerita TaxID=1973307 RepID=A0A8S0WIX2_CYCAE|nr:unnamed protein product [Cyclocybe aegerita]